MNNFPTLYEESCLALSALKFLNLPDKLYQTRNSLGFDPSILQRSGIWGAANETMLNKVLCIVGSPWSSLKSLYSSVH